MALGDILLGSDTAITVGDTAPPSTQVSGLNRWAAPSARTRTIRKYYPPTTPKTIVGDPEDTFTLSGDLTNGDDGQQYIFAKYRSGDEFYIQILDGNGDGFYQKVRCSNAGPSGDNPDNPNAVEFQFGGTDAPVDVGGGLG